MGIANLSDPSLFREQAYIAGEWMTSSSGRTLSVTNPATGEVIGTIPACTAAETQRAIEAADRVQSKWKTTSPDERADILMAWYDLILQNADDLALIMTVEQGKPLSESKGEVKYGATFIKWFAEEARRINGAVITPPQKDRRVLTVKQPVGTTAAITPWNFPNAMITRKCGPAFAAGCSMVLKPSELTPYSALALAVLAERAGLPKGLFSLVTGDAKEIGPELTSSPVVRKLSFTGSTHVGALLMRQSADTIKRLSLELGGNAPFIIFDDADLETAVAGALASKFRNAGQTCVCANRIFVQDGIHDRFVARMKEEVARFKVGNGLEEGVTMGPLINEGAVRKVREHVEDALSKGASYVSAPLETNGNFATPVVLEGVTTEMRVFSEETFGPLMPIFKFSDEAEAIRKANDTPFGLASYFFTTDMSRAWRVGEALEYGMVGVNTGMVSMECAPFGGVKQSGLGREGGAEGIEEFLEVKALHMAGLKL
ncbi:MAG: NAD-dependent succinate-semialdehyde dehydrogenase [Acetobacter aceti]|uniref:NAD-dependent succinate-semialdehyde dehydrogenase n=1 Tax=Acetobacter aceti TaxID=435 RepID=A0A1U9KD37_ACEAC|nr:NAD-dependent succinate-semialdehyde dehydrogenase [Acetobacter aceti]AQS83692.1 NAD-dependent succinate-semialdehyde dehydrogenase [Acetobacter aceti]